VSDTLTTMGMIAIGLVGGGVAGAAFFGGLAVTVRHLPTSRRPAALVLGSLIGRLLVVGAVLVGLAGLGAPALLAGLGALIVVRTLLVRNPRDLTGPAGSS
jgi:F1F0 ATPase subunit 2